MAFLCLFPILSYFGVTQDVRKWLCGDESWPKKLLAHMLSLSLVASLLFSCFFVLASSQVCVLSSLSWTSKKTFAEKRLEKKISKKKPGKKKLLDKKYSKKTVATEPKRRLALELQSSRPQEWNDSLFALRADNSWMLGRGKRCGLEHGSQARKICSPEVFELQRRNCFVWDCGSSVQEHKHYRSTNSSCPVIHAKPQQSKVQLVVSFPLQEGDAKWQCVHMEAQSQRLQHTGGRKASSAHLLRSCTHTQTPSRWNSAEEGPASITVASKIATWTRHELTRTKHLGRRSTSKASRVTSTIISETGPPFFLSSPPPPLQGGGAGSLYRRFNWRSHWWKLGLAAA